MDYELTDNQQQFVDDARNSGYEIDFEYSGRGMYGDKCPAIRVDDVTEFSTEADTQWDNMGLGYVIYAP